MSSSRKKRKLNGRKPYRRTHLEVIRERRAVRQAALQAEILAMTMAMAAEGEKDG